MNKVFAVIAFALAFGIYFFDELYKLGSLEWLPEILAALTVTLSLYLWNPGRFKQRPKDESPARSDDANR